MPGGFKIAGKPVDVEAGEQAFHAAMAAPAADEPLAAGPPKVEQAKYGLKADGTPRKRPAGPGRTPARTQAAGTHPAGGAKPVAETPQDALQRRTEGIESLFQFASAGTLMMWMRTDQKSWQADTITLSEHAPAVARAVAETAAVNPKFAALIDKVTAVGPYGALISAVLPLMAQLASNHGIAVGRAMGGKTPEELISEFESANANPVSGA